MGQIKIIIINPILFRLGINKDWNLKFIEKKNIDLNNYYFYCLEIFNFIHVFLKKYGFNISNIKLFYNKNNIKIYIIFYVSITVFKKVNTKINKVTFLRDTKLNSQLIIINYQLSYFKYYIKLKHINKICKYIKNKNWFLSKNLVINYMFFRLNVFKFIYFMKCKFNNLKYEFFFNRFFNKFLISLKCFFNNQICVFIVFKQLIKNTDSKLLFNTNKQFLIFNILKLRKFDKLHYFRHILNLLYYYLVLDNKAILISYLLFYYLPNIKEIKKVNLFFKFINNIFNLFFIKLYLFKGLKIILKGNLTKNKRANKTIIKMGNFINNSKINNNLNFDQITCFTLKGTLGIKIYIKN